MKEFDYIHAYKKNFITRHWERIKTARKQIIAADYGLRAEWRQRDGIDVR